MVMTCMLGLIVIVGYRLSRTSLMVMTCKLGLMVRVLHVLLERADSMEKIIKPFESRAFLKVRRAGDP